MNEKLSAYMDNELDELETRRLLAALAGDEALRAAWGRYHLAGAVLRREPLAPADVAARVAAQLRTQTRPRPAWQPLVRLTGQLALAASVAAIAIVGAQWWLKPAGEPPATVAQNAAPPVEYLRARGSRWDTNQREKENTLNAYLVEHNEFALTSGVSGMLPYVRVVGYDSMDGEGRAASGTAAGDSER